MSPPAVSRPARRASCSSISASSPLISPRSRHQRIEQPRQPDRLARQIRPHQILARGRGIAFGEDQIDHREHAAQPRLQRLALRHLIGNAGEPDFLLGAQQPLRHRLFAGEKRTRDLRGGEPADRAQRQRHLDLGGKGRMAAGEDQPQHVVVERGVRRPRRRRGLQQQFVRQRLLLAAKRDVAADAVDRLVAADIDQPRARIGRQRRSPASAPAPPRTHPAAHPRARSKSPTRRISVASALPASSRNIFSISLGVMRDTRSLSSFRDGPKRPTRKFAIPWFALRAPE